MNDLPEFAPQIATQLFHIHDDEAPRAVGISVLREGKPTKLTEEDRARLISEVRQGMHHELEVDAVTFRQKDGHPNRNFLRFKPSTLAKLARSYVGKPVLRDHNTWSTVNRLGTITKSELVEKNGWSEIHQTLRVVKADAVISVLDGTFDQFSIGWHNNGPVLCTVHGKDLRSLNSCRCWPGDQVEVDGGAQIVEYEAQSAEGKETSNVVVPAVSGTRPLDTRVALALSAELGLYRSHQQEKESQMKFGKLAALIGLASLTEADEDAACAAVDGKIKALEARARNAENALVAANANAAAGVSAELATATKRAEDAELQLAITVAYHEGRLAYVVDPSNPSKLEPDEREAEIRELAASSLSLARKTLAKFPKQVPVGGRLGGSEPDRTKFPQLAVSEHMETALASTAKQLGLTVEQLKANMTGGQ